MTDSAPRLLVLGATSLIGRALIAELDAQGRPFQLISRSPPETGGPWLQADLTGPDLADRLTPLDTVVSLSPLWLLPVALPALMRMGLRRLVAFSSTSRTTKAASPIAQERAVAARLAHGEAEVERLCDETGVAWTILRPTLIYDEGRDANVSRLAGLIRRYRVLPICGAGGGLRQPVHAADLAWGALAALERPQTFGRAYDLPGGETLTYRAMVERVFEGLGRRPRILPLPPALWRLGLSLAAPKDATVAMGARMDQDLAFDAAPAQRDFGWAPRPFRPDFSGA